MHLPSWLGVAVALLPTAAVAQVSVNVNVGVPPPPPPVVLVAPPPLVVVPGVTVVSYAPSVQLDLFTFQNRWYYSHAGYWYAGPTYKGPWVFVPVEKLPPPIVAVPVGYYKVPPGHLKKLEGGGPPGHAKGKGKGHP
jgi:hypothetical protein